MSTKLNEVKKHNCLSYTNGTVELIIPKDFGPRIIWAGFRGGKNVFGKSPFKMSTKWGPWRIYGGHRLWTSPEIFPDSYYPDNEKISYSFKGGVLTVSQELKGLKLKKQIELKFTGKNRVKVIHTIYNKGKKSQKFAIWALSVMGKGGFAVIPQNTKKEDPRQLLPNRNLVLWRYSDIKDKRFKLTNNNCYLKQGGKSPFKLGQRVPSGTASYFNKGILFTKKFSYNPKAEYADFHCNVEVYSCPDFLELESLSHLEEVKPGRSLTHVETWEFTKGKKLKFGK